MKCFECQSYIGHHQEYLCGKFDSFEEAKQGCVVLNHKYFFKVAKEENSGLSCNYYSIDVKFPYDGKDAYVAECGEIIEALDLTPYEATIFKEIWRQATARLGKQKKGNTEIRGAEKIYWNSEKLLNKARREYDN